MASALASSSWKLFDCIMLIDFVKSKPVRKRLSGGRCGHWINWRVYFLTVSEWAALQANRSAWKFWPVASRLWRSLKVIGTDMDRSATYDFLLTFHSNHGPISYRFRDKRLLPPVYLKKFMCRQHPSGEKCTSKSERRNFLSVDVVRNSKHPRWRLKRFPVWKWVIGCQRFGSKNKL